MKITAPSPTPSAAAPARPANTLQQQFQQAMAKGRLPLPAMAAQIPPDAGDRPPPMTSALVVPSAFAEPRLVLPREEEEGASAGAQGLFASQAAATPPAPPLPPPALNPAAFADIINQFWLREQHRHTREVRLRFGDDAWPATGASVRRLDDGSLAVEVQIDRHGRAGDMAALHRMLRQRGLPVSSLRLADAPNHID
jgi:hypothetical protein